MDNLYGKTSTKTLREQNLNTERHARELTKEVKAFVSKFKEFSGTELDMDLKHAQVCDQFRAELVKLQSQRCE